MPHAVLSSANSAPKPPLPTRFAFDGAAGEVLHDFFQRDAQQARLSTKFKLYYRLRPYIPIPLRQLLQRGRNQGIEAPENWYLPAEFVEAFKAAVQSEPNAVAIHPWPDGFQMSVVLTHDVETSIGVGLVDQVSGVGRGIWIPLSMELCSLQVQSRQRFAGGIEATWA